MNEALLIFPEFMTHDILRIPLSPPSHPSPASEGRRILPSLARAARGGALGGRGLDRGCVGLVDQILMQSSMLRTTR